MNIKGYIFDYGGTLDTDGCHWGKMLWHAYERQQVPIDYEQFSEAYVYAERTLGKNPIIQTDYTFHKTLELKLRIELEYLEEHGYVAGSNFTRASLQTALLDDLYTRVKATTKESREKLAELKKNYPLVLVSNFYGNIGVVLNEFGLDGIFEKVIESAVVGIRKPDARIYQMGVDALGLKPDETVVVGDSYRKDIVPAHSIGCHTIWLKGEQWKDETVEESVADRIITTIKDL